MKIDKLVLYNFRKHSFHQSRFPNNLTAIIGNNTSGKTTLLRAILFALFGTAAAGAKNSLQTRGSSDNPIVELLITLPQKGQLLIQRTLTGASVLQGADVLASGSTAVTGLISDAFGMDSKDLRLLMYSPQGEVKEIVRLGPTALQRLIERLAKVELIDLILKRTNADIAHLAGRLEGLAEIPDLEELRRSYSALESEYSEACRIGEEGQRNQHEAQEEYRELENQLQTAYEMLRRKSALEQKLESLIEGTAKMESQSAQLSTRLANLPPMDEETRSQAKTVCSQWDSYLAELNKSSRQFEVFQERLRKDQAELKFLEAKIERHHAAVQHIAQLEAEEGSLNAVPITEEYQRVLTLHNEAIRQLEKSVCPTCHRPFDEHSRQVAQECVDNHAKLLPGLKEQADSIMARIKGLQQQRNAETRYLFQGAENQVQQTRQSIEYAEKNITELQEIFKVFDFNSFDELIVDKQKWRQEALDRFQALESQYKELSLLKGQQDSLFRELASIYSDTSKTRQELSGLPDSITHDTIESLRIRIAGVKEVYDAWHNRYMWAAVEKSRLHAALADLYQQQSKAENQLKERAEHTNKKALIEKLQKFLKTNRSELISDVWQGLLNYASYLISLATENRISSLFRKEDTLLVNEDGFEVPVNDLSGYQQSLVGLALRIALARVFYGSHLPLLLDEPAADATDENAARMAGMLKSLGTQVIMVTHRPGDQVNADAIVELAA